MQPMGSVLRAVTVVMALFFALPAAAQDSPPSPDEWQSVITSQIQAFREHNAEAALSYAAGYFHDVYKDAEQFYLGIVSTGYLPIATSLSHSFGEYRLSGNTDVLQRVLIVDNDQSLYEATYQLIKEPEGWRVHGVMLTKTPGVGV